MILGCVVEWTESVKDSPERIPKSGIVVACGAVSSEGFRLLIMEPSGQLHDRSSRYVRMSVPSMSRVHTASKT